MKRLTINSLAYVFFVLVIYGCSEKEVVLSTLVEREGVKYEVNKENPYSGKVFEHYESKQFKIKGHYDDGLTTGTWEFFYPNGQIARREEHHKGKPNGMTEYFNENGMISKTLSFKEGEYDGEFKQYDDNGKLIEEGNFVDGKRDGLQKKYNNEKLVSSEMYREDVLDGPSEYYYDSGSKMRSGEYVQNQKNGTWIDFYDGNTKSKEQTYQSGKLTGESLWYTNGNLSYHAIYPGSTKWFSEDGTMVAEAQLTNASTLNNPSSLKILANGKWIIPYEILHNSYWETEKQDLDMKYQNTRKIGYHHKLKFEEGRYIRRKQYRDGYGFNGIGLVNSGRWSFVVSELPQLYIEIVPDNNCRECERETLSLFDISENQILLDETLFKIASEE